MSKRQITHRQSRRIAKNQANLLIDKEALNEGITEEGTLITRLNTQVVVEARNGTIVLCAMRANIDSLVPGDQVIWQATGVNQGVVLSRFPRQTELVRPDKHHKLRPVAANLTQLIIVVAPKPEISWSLLDSYLVLAQYLGLNVVIVVNKIDLPCTTLKETLSLIYKPLGYTIIEVSQCNPEGFIPLTEHLKHNTSIVVGQSGVGKSSLICYFLPPHQTIETGEISKISELGKHTTSNARLYHLPSGGDLIDSPGVREFGLWHVDSTIITAGFREFSPFLSCCKYRNCNHIDNSGCGLLTGLREGKIHPNRIEQYHKLLSQYCI